MFRRIWQTSRRQEPEDKTLLDPFDAYQLWARTYDATGGSTVFYAERKVISPLLATHDFRQKVVLDAGCGTGRNFSLLSESHPRLIVGTDFSPNMVSQATAKQPGLHVHVLLAPIEHLPFKDMTFDLLLSTLVLGHVLDLDAALCEMGRVLARQGCMIVSTFHPFSDLLGWQRLFKADRPGSREKWFAAQYHKHSHAEYFSAFQNAGLEIVRMEEPGIEPSLRPLYERADRLDVYNRYLGYPLLLVLEARKK